MTVLESVEGAGKGSAAKYLREYFIRKEIDCLFTREPGGTPLAEEIREMLLKKRDEKMHDTTEILLMFASRSQHLNQLIIPALNAGQWILSERFDLSSKAYQVAGRGLDINIFNSLRKIVCGDFNPDLTIVLDIDVELGMKRAMGRGELDRIETESLEFFDRARQCFLSEAKLFPHRFAVVDASKSLEEVREQIESVMDNFVSKVQKVNQYDSDSRNLAI